jgi:hypothetical protein
LSVTCIAVISSTISAPDFFAALPAALIRRMSFGNDVKSAIMPMLWPAIARTSHSGHSVCLDQSAALS